MRFKFFFTLFFLISLTPVKLFACTGMLLNSRDGSIVTGRTVEFATKLDMSIALVPRNLEFTAKTPLGDGLSYHSKYAAVGVYCFSNKIIMDGMNEKGLVAAAFFFPGYASYTPSTTQNQHKSLSPVDFTNWILTQFSSIDEVLQAIKSVSISPTVIEGWGSTPPPFHYVVYESTGKSIVIEPIDGKLVSYDNLIGSITNSPTFDWHITNLANYINLSIYNANPKVIRGQKLQVYGQGSGLHGLPGDFSSTSRFVRSSIFSTSAIPPLNKSELPNHAFHILNQFDIPVGSVREKNRGNTLCDTTQLTTVKDPNSLRYYYKSYADQNIKFVDLGEVDLNIPEIKSFLIEGNQLNEDMSSCL